MESEKTFSQQHPSSSHIGLKLAGALGDLEPVDLQALKCSVPTAHLTNCAPEQCHQPAALSNTLRKRIANYARIMSNATGGNKPVPRTTEDVKTVQRFVKREQCVLSQPEHDQILVHAHTALKPIVSIASANFYPCVIQALEHLGIRKVYQMQGYAWRHIMRGNSVICVNSAGTGKTLAYLPAACSLIKLNIEEKWVPSDPGPVGIIICPSSMEVQRISTLCRALLNSEAEKQLSVVECYDLRLVNPVLNELLAGCAILVSTAPAYRRLYEAMPETFVPERIELVVIDNIVEIVQHFGPDLQLLCKSCDKPDRQMIVTANHWDPLLRSFQLRYNMITLIGAHLEAAVYGKVQFQLRLHRNDRSKQNELARYLLEHNYRSQRTIVFGSTVVELDLIRDALRHYFIEHLVCNDSINRNQYESFGDWTNESPGGMGVLVCLDELVDCLSIANAQHIVHYSLPDTWTRFCRRFATSFKYFVLDSGGQAKARPSTLVLVDKKYNQQLPKLIDFLELHHVQYPAELCALAQNIRNAGEYVRVTNG